VISPNLLLDSVTVFHTKNICVLYTCHAQFSIFFCAPHILFEVGGFYSIAYCSIIELFWYIPPSKRAKRTT